MPGAGQVGVAWGGLGGSVTIYLNWILDSWLQVMPTPPEAVSQAETVIVGTIIGLWAARERLPLPGAAKPAI